MTQGRLFDDMIFTTDNFGRLVMNMLINHYEAGYGQHDGWEACNG